MENPILAKNFFDRAVEAIAPNWAAKRYAARAQIEFARSMPMGSYRGAIGTRTSAPWETTSSYRGGTSSDRRQLGGMRDRARRVYRENVIGRSLLDTETDNIIAEGFSLQMKSASGDFNKEAESRFYDWLENADVAGKWTAADWFRGSWSEPRKDGDGGIVLVTNGGRPALQYIPGDRIINPLGRYDPLTMFDGVECDGAGRAIRYWIRDDIELLPKYDAVPVDARDFVYLSHRDDPLSIRGASVYGPIFGELDQLDGYKEAVIYAARLACIFGLIEKRKNPAAYTNPLSTLANSQGEQQKAITLENGMLKVIGSEDSVFQVQAQQPMSQTPDFIRAILRIICLRFDMPLEIGQKDLSQVNFSGGRIGLLGYYRSCRVKQDWIKSKAWNRIVYWWLCKERQRQQLGFTGAFKTAFPEDFGNFTLHGREWDYTDPETEGKADLLEISMGIKSPQIACEERGRDWGSIQTQLAEARKSNADLGIPTVLSSHTRDENQKVTAVDAQGNPITGGEQPLNGAQITAAIDVMVKLREETLAPEAAVQLLGGLGINPDAAKAIVDKTPRGLDSGPGDAQFKREILKQLLAVPAAREAVYNGVDINDLIASTGLPPEKDYQAPWIPVIAPAGDLVSGATVRDPEGDVVGGDVENDRPVADGTFGGGTRNDASVPTKGGEPAVPATPQPKPDPAPAPDEQAAALGKLADAVSD